MVLLVSASLDKLSSLIYIWMHFPLTLPMSKCLWDLRRGRLWYANPFATPGFSPSTISEFDLLHFTSETTRGQLWRILYSTRIRKRRNEKNSVDIHTLQVLCTFHNSRTVRLMFTKETFKISKHQLCLFFPYFFKFLLRWVKVKYFRMKLPSSKKYFFTKRSPWRTIQNT